MDDVSRRYVTDNELYTIPELSIFDEVIKLSLRSVLKPVLTRITTSSFYSLYVRATIGTIIRASVRGRRFASTGNNKIDVVLTPVGDGNNGDQAMMESHAKHLAGDTILITEGNRLFPVRSRDGVTQLKIEPMTKLLGLPFPLNASELWKFGQILAKAQHLYIHGADTMDGGSARYSLARLAILTEAELLGVRTAILGFSWRESVPVTVKSAIVRYSHHGYLYPRDPKSYQRLISIGAVPEHVFLAADMAFALDSEQEPELLFAQYPVLKARPYALLNISGLLNSRGIVASEYRQAVDTLHEHGLTVVFIPHVARSTDDDVAACQEAFALLGDVTDVLVDRVLCPEQIRFLARRAVVTVSGRMHLAILSLSTGTPAIPISTAGKVEGLLEMFSLSAFAIEPGPSMGPALAERISSMMRSLNHHRAVIQAKLPGIKELALSNFRHS